MSKKKWSPDGKSIEDLLKLGTDYNRYRQLTEPTLKQVVNRLASAANKRARRMEASGNTSPAYKQMQESGGKFSTKDKGLDELRLEFLRVKAFLEDDTSSLLKWETMQRHATEGAVKEGIITPPSQGKTKNAPPQGETKSTPSVEYEEGVMGESQEVEDTETDYYVDEDTGEIIYFEGSIGRNKYANGGKDNEDYFKTVGDLWDAVDLLVDTDVRYRDRAFRYAVYDALEQGYLTDQMEGATIDEVREKLESRVEDIYRDFANQKAEAQKRGVGSFF